MDEVLHAQEWELSVLQAYGLAPAAADDGQPDATAITVMQFRRRQAPCHLGPRL